jgi:prephenate dehydrogenase
MAWRRVCILGVGLLGGSIGMRLIRDRLAEEVVGFGRDQSKLDLAEELQAIHRGSRRIDEAAAGAELIVACTPVQQIAESLCQAASHALPTAILTDVGSTKRTLVAQMLQTPFAERFVGSHPLAGSDKSGVASASANLFDGKLCLITPQPVETAVVEHVAGFWEALGMRVVRLTPEGHDEAMAATSHLPHVVASILAASTPPAMLKLVGTGWLDTTRIAGGAPELWRQILEENQAPALRALKNFATISQEWIEALEAGDFARVEQLLNAGKHIRDSVGNQHSSG